MHDKRLMITYLILRGPNEYYTGAGWDNNIGRACLYMALGRAESVLEGMQAGDLDAKIRCVIQNKSFDYFDGQKFVYELSLAKLYSPEEVEDQLRMMTAPA
jgi:hypothetical protein